MPFELPTDRRTERRQRITRWVSFAVAAFLVALVTYLGYVAYEGSGQLVEPPSRSDDCRTPATMGWTYEAINYDQATDARLATEADPEHCTQQGATAGDTLMASDDVPIAGWYIPAASGADATGPTVVLTHGWGSNKSNLLGRAAILHTAYNLVLFDFRNHGQSGDAMTTQGVAEQSDLDAVLDWLETAKGPEQVAVLGVSMGGATAINEADDDDRVDAMILESTHATLANAAERRLARAGYPLSLPGSWAILLGALVRTGLDMSAVDPVQAISRFDERPLLIVSGAADDAIGPTDSADLVAAAQEAGSPVTLEVCVAAGHGDAPEQCPDEYAGWVLGFLDRTIGAGD
jgi:pimeloyl-ACP methyl ester carboxylesterase